MKNQKGFANIALVIVIVILAGTVGYFALRKTVPVTQEPTPTPAKKSNQLNQPQTQGIVVEQPSINQEVVLPITVKGYINGNGWAAFEGVAGSVQVFDANNKAISERMPLQTTSDWMKFPVYFKVTVGDRQMMSYLATKTGALVFKSENEKDGSSIKEFRLPIKFAK